MADIWEEMEQQLRQEEPWASMQKELRESEVLAEMQEELRGTTANATLHFPCDCVPALGPVHCHGCGEWAGKPVEWVNRSCPVADPPYFD